MRTVAHQSTHAPSCTSSPTAVLTTALLLELRRLEHLERELHLTLRLTLEDLASSRQQRAALLAQLAEHLDDGGHLPADAFAQDAGAAGVRP